MPTVSGNEHVANLRTSRFAERELFCATKKNEPVFSNQGRGRRVHPRTLQGRLGHRFLIHYVLSKRHFGPDKVIFPVSAAMLQNSRKYDESLEAFSEPSLALIEHELEQDGRLLVHSQTKDLYRYIDCTVMGRA